MIEKFERIEEPKKNRDSVESILFILIFMFLFLLAGMWYYQNKVMQDANYVRENEIKLLEQKQMNLEDEIDKVLQENVRLKNEIILVDSV